MVNIEEQQAMLYSIATNLENKVTAYAIGGTSMMFHGLKQTTVDIDLVFETENEREEFIKAAEKIGFKYFNPSIVYGEKRNIPKMLKLADDRLDLFVDKVVNFRFSDQMKMRAEAIIEYGDKLTLRIADPQDILIMKCATDRTKDKDDAMMIIKYGDINWETIIMEAENQRDLGEKRAVFELGCFLEDLGVEKPVLGRILQVCFKQD